MNAKAGISHTRQEKNTTAAKQAVTARNWKEQGAMNTLFCLALFGTAWPVWTLIDKDWEEADCLDGGFGVFFVFRHFSCLMVSPSREESSDILLRKEREAPTIGSGYVSPVWGHQRSMGKHQNMNTYQVRKHSKVTMGWESLIILEWPQLTLLAVFNNQEAVGWIIHCGPTQMQICDELKVTGELVWFS